MNSFLTLIAMPIIGRYRELLRRIHDLEVALDAMILSPEWQEDLTLYFNGQRERQKIFEELANTFRFGTVIETGTFLGNTTGYFAKYLPHAVIRSCELSARFHGLAMRRLKQFSNVELFCGDSRSFLLAQNIAVGAEQAEEVGFIYLDAHWHSDLPLRKELEICQRELPNAIIMVDDFEVRNDPGYAFDNYGKGKSLSFVDFRPVFRQLRYVSYSPVATSSQETGARRGCVVLALEGNLCDRVDGVKSLKRTEGLS